MARRFDPLVEAVIDVIAERVPDFDPEVIADLIEVVGDDVWVSTLGPAVDQVMQRIGLGSHVASSDEEPPDPEGPDPSVTGGQTSRPLLVGGGVHVSKSSHTQPEPKVGKILSCPGCNRTVRSADGWCPHCGAFIGEHPNEGGP